MTGTKARLTRLETRAGARAPVVRVVFDGDPDPGPDCDDLTIRVRFVDFGGADHLIESAANAP